MHLSENAFKNLPSHNTKKTYSKMEPNLVERQIWRLYIFQIFFRSCIDIGFMVIQFYAYPYQ